MTLLLLLFLTIHTSFVEGEWEHWEGWVRPTPYPVKSQTCVKCVSVIDSYRRSHHVIESVRRTRSELMGRCHRWSGGVIPCTRAMSDTKNIRLLQASFMELKNTPHLSCIAIKMCDPLDYDIYLKRTHEGEKFTYELPPDFNEKLRNHYKNIEPQSITGELFRGSNLHNSLTFTVLIVALRFLL